MRTYAAGALGNVPRPEGVYPKRPVGISLASVDGGPRRRMEDEIRLEVCDDREHLVPVSHVKPLPVCGHHVQGIANASDSALAK